MGHFTVTLLLSPEGKPVRRFPQAVVLADDAAEALNIVYDRHRSQLEKAVRHGQTFFSAARLSTLAEVQELAALPAEEAMSIH